MIQSQRSRIGLRWSSRGKKKRRSIDVPGGVDLEAKSQKSPYKIFFFHFELLTGVIYKE